MPSELQILGAQLRAAEEEWVKKHRKPYGAKDGSGGWLVPGHEERNAYLSKKFGIEPWKVSYFFTYSRACQHPWSDGACEKCPSVGVL